MEISSMNEKRNNSIDGSGLENYLARGVEQVVKGILKASLRNPAAAAFMMKYRKSCEEAAEKRAKSAESGKHIPPFLIASITTSCNLHCKGCYARANNSCFDEAQAGSASASGIESASASAAGSGSSGGSLSAAACSNVPGARLMSAARWSRVFDEAEDLGISFILLAGGEPMLRRDVIKAAGEHRKIIFPVFTNGTMFTQENIELISARPNILPVLSIEGSAKTTDERRGEGVHDRLMGGMASLRKKGVVFGSSVTVQKNNMREVMGDDFVTSLIGNGCKAVIYVEYVPADPAAAMLAPDDTDRGYMAARLEKLREKYPQMLFIAFPGDEKASGGCLAAGRGFFHINAAGGAEPCPFSPYSDTTLLDTSLEEALQSPLFTKLRTGGMLTEDHAGGCVLFDQEDAVMALRDQRGAVMQVRDSRDVTAEISGDQECNEEAAV